MIQFNNKPPKKLIVKGLKSKPKVPEEYEATTLARISATIDAVFAGQSLPYGHEEIYHSCETLCKFHLSGQIYRLIYEKCEKQAIIAANALIAECKEIMDEADYLIKFDAAWTAFKRHYMLLESLFLYLDRVVIPRSSHEGFVPIRSFGNVFFRSYSLNQLQSTLTNGQVPAQSLLLKLITLFNRLRTDNVQSGNLFELAGRLVSMIRELEVYSDETLNFERVFIQASIEFYERESSDFASKSSLADYLQYASNRLQYENENISSIVASSSNDKLISAVQATIINNRFEYMFPAPSGSSLRGLFDMGDLTSLRLLYELINRVHAIDTLTREWSAFIRVFGHHLLATVHEASVIDAIAKFKDQIDTSIRDCFYGDSHLQGAVQDSFESFINARGDRMVELLVLYIHNHMQKSMSPERATSFINMSLALFRYLYRKESFDNYYKRCLAHRLLFGVSADLELESHFVSELGRNCGENFVMRMESMLKDWKTSEDYNKNFKDLVKKKEASVTTISVISILWPQTLKPDAPMKIPSAIREIEAAFSNFYLEQKKDAKLSWNRRMGSCVMNGYFGSSSTPKELILTTPQALVLLQFNNHDALPMSRLALSLEMQPEMLTETIDSLATPSFPVLLRQGDIIAYNNNFTSEMKKIPLFMFQSPFLDVAELLPKSEGLPTSTNSTPDLSTAALAAASRKGSAISDRQLQVDCLLVRRMKSISKCPRSDLINYTLANLPDLPISVADVNGRIDGLIEKEFVKVVDSSFIAYMP